MSSSSGFEFFEHTADVGIRAWGPDQASAFIQAAYGLRELLTGGASIAARERQEVAIHVTADDVAQLLVAWLQECVVLFDLEHLLMDHATIHACTPRQMRATIHAIRCDPSRQPLGREVKAITYHQLRVDVARASCRIDVIVDI